jgi:S1-C subfamily serine protease
MVRPVTTVDWIIALAVLLLALWGYQQGFVVGLLSLAGFGGGAFLGGRLAPALLSGGSKSPYTPLIALTGAILVGGIVAVTLEALAWGLRQRFLSAPAVQIADGVGGAVLVGALGLALAWVAGAAALHAPGARGLRHDIQRSAILKRLNAALPPSGPILNVLNRIDPTPAISGPRAAVSAPDPRIAHDPDVARAGQSVVKVLGTACGLGIEGSGWVAAPGVVVTNAHVVAGEDDTTVTPMGGGQLKATPVRYDPHNDIAVLRVPSLAAPPLAFAPSPSSGTSGAVLGYPENGPYRVAAARLGATETVITQDSYGRGPVRRRIASLRGRVVSGNSGGPMVDGAGQVLATVFASSTDHKGTGFGIPDDIVGGELAKAGAPVSTGPCAP